MKTWWSARGLPRALRRAMRERRSLQDRPWEENLLHWARDGTLHGTINPPPGGRRRSVTSDGWCPAWAIEEQRRYLPDSFSSSVSSDENADRSVDGDADGDCED